MRNPNSLPGEEKLGLIVPVWFEDSCAELLVVLTKGVADVEVVELEMETLGDTGGGIVVGKGVVVGTAFTGLVVVDPKRERISTLVASRATGNPPFQRVNVGTLGFGFTVMKLKPAGRVPVSLVNSQTLVRGVAAKANVGPVCVCTVKSSKASVRSRFPGKALALLTTGT